jgi:hypothetical protein
MNEVAEYRFNTKTGTCVLTSERIVLSREGVSGVLAKQVYGDSINRALIIYSAIGVISLVIAVLLIINKRYFEGVFACIVGGFFLWNVFSSRNNSAKNIIEKHTVQSLEVHPPHPPFTRGYFKVYFLDDGKRRRRLIMLPGSMSGGKEEFKKALSCMRQAGWYIA